MLGKILFSLSDKCGLIDWMVEAPMVAVKWSRLSGVAMAIYVVGDVGRCEVSMRGTVAGGSATDGIGRAGEIGARV